jgi:hypothetical protein
MAINTTRAAGVTFSETWLGRLRRITISHARVVCIAWFVPILAGTLSTAASAKCGTGTIDYADIEAVLLAQNGCGATIGSFTQAAPQWRLVKNFGCSTYWAFFWETGPARTSEYSQYDLSGETGTYRLSVTIAEVRDILRKDSFYSLSPRDIYRTDTAQWVISVKRCAVITRVRIFTGPNNSEPTAGALLQDLSDLVQKSSKVRLSEPPKAFVQSGVFDPLPL